MKSLVCFIWVWLGCMQGFSQQTKDMPLSGRFDSLSREAIFRKLENKDQFRFYFLSKWLPKDPVSFTFSSTPLHEVMDSLLSDTRLSYYIYRDFAILIGPKNKINSLWDDIPVDKQITTASPEPALPETSIFDDDIQLQEVVVSDVATDKNVRTAQAGVTELSIKEIKKLPTLMGEPDVIRSLLSLPGVNTVGEGAGGFNVRGGNVDQNLVLLDGAVVFNSSHVLGLFSSFNSDALEKVTLYKGNIPAQFGGRLSSVLDVRCKDGDFNSWKLNGGIGPFASRLVIEGPVVKEKTSVMIGVRSVYSDWVLGLSSNPQIQKSSGFFYDWNARITQRIGQNGTIFLSGYDTYDKFRYSDEFGFSWRTRVFSLGWRQIYHNDLSSSLTLHYGVNKNTNFDPAGVDAFDLSNGQKYYQGRLNFLLTHYRNHQINAGIEVTQYEALPEIYHKSDLDQAIGFTEKYQKDRGRESSIYLNDEFDLGARFSISAGLRYTFYQALGPGLVHLYQNGVPDISDHIIDSVYYNKGDVIKTYGGLEPRLSVNYKLNRFTSLKFSYNILNQYIHQISNTVASTPVDLWQVSNYYLPPRRTQSFSLGFFKNLDNNKWETSAEVYYKIISDLVEYKDFASLLRNNHLETELLGARGKSYGLELFIKKKVGKLTGWLSYTYSRSIVSTYHSDPFNSVNRGNWYPANFDRPHNINLVCNYNFLKTLQFAFNFTYGTGRPVTAPLSYYQAGSVLVPNYSDRNQFRIPDYHRLDISFTFNRGLIKTKRLKNSFTISVYNLYFRQNAFSVFFKQSANRNLKAYQLAVLGKAFPSLSYNIQF